MVHLLGKVWHITYLYAVRTALSQGATCFQITLDMRAGHTNVQERGGWVQECALRQIR